VNASNQRLHQTDYKARLVRRIVVTGLPPKAMISVIYLCAREKVHEHNYLQSHRIPERV